jgi:hypothetical protein
VGERKSEMNRLFTTILRYTFPLKNPFPDRKTLCWHAGMVPKTTNHSSISDPNYQSSSTTGSLSLSAAGPLPLRCGPLAPPRPLIPAVQETALPEGFCDRRGRQELGTRLSNVGEYILCHIRQSCFQLVSFVTRLCLLHPPNGLPPCLL